MSGSDCGQVPQGLRSIQLAWGSVPHLPETAGGRGVRGGGPVGGSQAAAPFLSPSAEESWQELN